MSQLTTQYPPKSGKASKDKHLFKQQQTMQASDASTPYVTGSHRQVTQTIPEASMSSPPPANASLTTGPPSSGQQRKQGRQHQGLQSLYKDSKEEMFHIKTARTYFCLQNMVSAPILVAFLIEFVLHWACLR